MEKAVSEANLIIFQGVVKLVRRKIEWPVNRCFYMWPTGLPLMEELRTLGWETLSRQVNPHVR